MKEYTYKGFHACIEENITNIFWCVQKFKNVPSYRTICSQPKVYLWAYGYTEEEVLNNYRNVIDDYLTEQKLQTKDWENENRMLGWEHQIPVYNYND